MTHLNEQSAMPANDAMPADNEPGMALIKDADASLLNSAGVQIICAKDPQRAGLAAALWPELDSRRQAAILWDVPGRYKRNVFHSALQKADFCAFALRDGTPLACLYMLAIGKKTAMSHFISAGSYPWLAAAGRVAIAHCPYSCLLAQIPAPWHGARNLAASLGFSQIARLPKACFIADKNAHKDAALYLRQIQN